MKNVLFAFSIMVAIGFFVLTSPAAQSDESAFYMDATSLETAAVADAPAHSNVFSSFVHYIREKIKKVNLLPQYRCIDIEFTFKSDLTRNG
jgi:hypothetical protein